MKMHEACGVSDVDTSAISFEGSNATQSGLHMCHVGTDCGFTEQQEAIACMKANS